MKYTSPLSRATHTHCITCTAPDGQWQGPHPSMEPALVESHEEITLG